jgi:twitching motility protein PilT
MSFDMDLDAMAKKSSKPAAPAGGPVKPGATQPPAATEAPATPPAAPAGPVSAPGATSTGVSILKHSGAPALNIDQLLTEIVKQGASDLHMSAGSVPMMRLNGNMTPIENAPKLTPESLAATVDRILTEDQKAKFETAWELDFAYVVEGVSRFRANIMVQRGAVGAVFRIIPEEILPLEKLDMPTVLYNLSSLPRGLVLVTGPTGSGKSTTLASLIDRANRTRQGHIITIEDPIEFTHQHRSSIVNQREVGQDTHSYQDALKHVLRQDPDIILIGEMRDLETISTALTAAETGHLVFATLHTQSAQETVSRIIDVFPEAQQQQVRSQLAATLKAVVCQTLVPSVDGSRRYAAAEIMIVDSAIATLIRRDATHQIGASLQAGSSKGMQTLNMALAEMVAEKKISKTTAEEATNDIEDLETLITGKTQDIRKERQKTPGATAPDGPPPAKPGGLGGSSM